MCATALASRNSHTAEWIALLPRTSCEEKSRERYVSRFLANALICSVSVMTGFISELMKMTGSNGKIIILSLDQSKILDGFECLMFSLRIGEKAISVVWRVIETKGAIGFDVQERLLEDAKAIIPEGLSILLAAGRFYGTFALISWCQKEGWQYRIRLKGNLIFQPEGGEITASQTAQMQIAALENTVFNHTQIKATLVSSMNQVTKSLGL